MVVLVIVTEYPPMIRGAQLVANKGQVVADHLAAIALQTSSLISPPPWAQRTSAVSSTILRARSGRTIDDASVLQVGRLTPLLETKIQPLPGKKAPPPILRSPLSPPNATAGLYRSDSCDCRVIL